ncbi:IQ domain-containing protein F3-like [Mus caroli]|uniref:IQ domain-containing protein F3-like n=1 Tax=Mus caroli TaxID=10089 RepID=A0A6P7RDH6_MUSCR|nr:IQ domain-containing protein F3-like [Mus caroli]
MGALFVKPKPKVHQQTKTTQPKLLPLKQPKDSRIKKTRAAKKIQALWRGFLVRQTLLAAALNVWVIQCWWRSILHRQVLKRRLAMLRIYVIEEEAAVRLQAWVRMWNCRRYFNQICNQICNTLCVVQSAENSFAFKNDDILQVQYEVVSRQPEFHIEILSI